MDNKRNVKMAFVILHYNSIDDTEACVSSIERLRQSEDCCIVIVDNASPNNTGIRLRDRYRGKSNINVVLANENYGFSKGNNIGYRLVKNHYNADFITICNNDIVFEDIDFIEKTETLYEQTGFYVMGPDVYNPKLGIHQSPLGADSPSKKAALRTIALNTAAEFTFPIYWVLFGKRQLMKQDIRDDSVSDYDMPKENVPIMGACITFSKDMAELRNNAFEPMTFLYYEEYLLFNYCRDKQLKIVYSPDIKVIHNEGAATATAAKDKKDKYKRLIHNIRKAAIIYYDSLKKPMKRKK